MREPFHQTILMDIFDTTTALARVEQRFLWCSFASTYSTNARGVIRWLWKVVGSSRVTGMALGLWDRSWVFHDD
jgi:hypothetical protein